MPRAVSLLGVLLVVAGCARRPTPLPPPAPYEDYAVESRSITAPPPSPTEQGAAQKGRLWRFDLNRGNTRNGAGFTVIARETPDRGRVVAMEFDGTLVLGTEQHKASGFGGVALVAFDKNGKFLWSRKLDGNKYHYVKALEVAPDGDILVGGAFGKFGLALLRLSPEGEVRWRLEPTREPAWSEVSSMAIDSEGNIAVVGIFQSRLDLPGTKALTSRYFDAFVARVDGKSGKVTWIQQISSPEAKASGVYVAESGDVIVVGDFKRELKVGDRTASGERDFYVARFSAGGALELLAPIALGFVGRVQSVQPLAGGMLALHIQGDKSRHALLGIAEADGRVAWKIDENVAGAVLGSDARTRPERVLFGVHEVEPSFGSRGVRLREIGKDGKTAASRFLDSGPYLFMTSGRIRRTARGMLVSGSLRDQHWDNDGFYPFVLDVDAMENDMNLVDMTPIGRGTGPRCRAPLAKKLVWKDVRVAVSYKLGELRGCDVNLQTIGAQFELEPEGTVTKVTLVGKVKGQEVTCLGNALRTLRVCPFEGAKLEVKMVRLE